MKKRLGFVGNSSSCSFVITKGNRTIEDIKDTIQDFINIYNKNRKFKRYYKENPESYPEIKNIDDILYIEEYKKGDNFQAGWRDIKVEEDVIVVNGSYDNSIPYEIMQGVENFLNGEHYHNG